MKLSPKIYAQILIDSTKTGDLKVIASNFWKLLQKNKQYKDLPKILDCLDEEHARLQGKVIVKVFTEEKLGEIQEKEIKSKLIDHVIKGYKTDQILIKNIIQKNAGGILLKIEDKIIDLSTIGKLNKLKGIIK